mmetsp:Transcript_795/g.2522  ORF Transcript_795/g.2522 Transcript_795/m.2522 type:complete len:294 (-) Transcript_795:604-1485(-)
MPMRRARPRVLPTNSHVRDPIQRPGICGEVVLVIVFFIVTETSPIVLVVVVAKPAGSVAESPIFLFDVDVENVVSITTTGNIIFVVLVVFRERDRALVGRSAKEVITTFRGSRIRGSRRPATHILTSRLVVRNTSHFGKHFMHDINRRRDPCSRLSNSKRVGNLSGHLRQIERPGPAFQIVASRVIRNFLGIKANIAPFVHGQVVQQQTTRSTFVKHRRGLLEQRIHVHDVVHDFHRVIFRIFQRDHVRRSRGLFLLLRNRIPILVKFFRTITGTSSRIIHVLFVFTVIPGGV